MIRAGSIAGGARKRSIKGLAGRSEETMCRAHIRKLCNITHSPIPLLFRKGIGIIGGTQRMLVERDLKDGEEKTKATLK